MDIRDQLKALEREDNDIVTRTLKKGDLVRKSKDVYYVIDNPDIDRILANGNGNVSLEDVYHTLKPNFYEIWDKIGKRKKVPYSEVFNLGLGDCLEKSILVQLSSQRHRDSYLINGSYALDENQSKKELHAFNIVIDSDKAFIIDAEKPIRLGDNFLPYSLPIDELNEDLEILIPEIFNFGRKYFVRK